MVTVFVAGLLCSICMVTPSKSGCVVRGVEGIEGASMPWLFSCEWAVSGIIAIRTSRDSKSLLMPNAPLILCLTY